MTKSVRFLFDECFARPVIEDQVVKFFRLYGSNAEVVHLFSKFDSGIKDEIWIPQIAKEGGWIIITSDQGKKSKKGQKLPKICQDYLVTHIMLSAKLHSRNMYTKALAINYCLPDVLNTASFPPGTGFLLQIAERTYKFRLKKITDPPERNEGSPPQKKLFND